MQTQKNSIDRRTGDTRLVIKMMLAIFVCFAASLVFVAVLTFLKFDRIYLDTYAQRYDSVAREARDVIERSLGPGMSLEGNIAGSVAINRLAEQQKGDVAILLQNLGGTVIADTPGAPEMRGTALARVDTENPNALARTMSADQFTTSAAIRNDGVSVGVVTVVFDAAPAHEALAALQARMRAAAMGLFAVFAPIFAILVFAAIFPKERLFAREAAAMRRMADGEPAKDTGLVFGATEVIADLNRPDGAAQ
ncbi:MAG: hypothetical protein AAGF71_01485 [Pseudomonadota bacterium]